LSIDRDHLPWLARHARRLGYIGQRDYLNGILNTALLRELETNGEGPPASVEAAADEKFEEGIPF
jgi:hypothetical protein